MLDDTPWTPDDDDGDFENTWAEVRLGVAADGFVVAAYGCEEGQERLLADTLQEIVDDLRAELRAIH